jgi:hypothetical protein
VSLCSRMDIVALIFEDGLLGIFRTLSWERLLSIRLDDHIKIEDIEKILLSFGPSGNNLAMSGASAALLNIESGKSISILNDNHVDQIQHFHWIERNEIDEDTKKIFFQMENINIAAVAQSKQKTENFEPHFLSVLTSDNIITIYLYGFIPIKMIQFNTVERVSGLIKYSLQDHFIVATSHQQTTTAIDDSMNSIFTGIIKYPSLKIGEFQHIGLLLMKLHTLMGSIKDIHSNSAKKWKECLRILPAKLELMNTVLTSYELQMTPLEFFNSILLCGLWHPAASVIFSQHWNEQSLSRLRNSIENTLNYILRAFNLQVIPGIQTLIMFSR